MSEMEHWKGRIQLLPRLKNETDEDYFTRVTGQDYHVKGFSPENIPEAIYEYNLENDFLCANNTIYKFLIKKEISFEQNCCYLNRLSEDIIEFDASFYNGGTCLEELLEEELYG